MRKNIKKLLAITLSAGLMIAQLTGCGGSAGDNTEEAADSSNNVVEEADTEETVKAEDQEQIKLTLWHQWTTEEDGNKIAFDQVLDSFEEANPNILLEVTGQSSSDYPTKLKVAFAANEAPDIVYIQAPGDLTPFAEAGKLYDLSDLIAVNKTDELVLPGTLDNFTVNDGVYGLPTITSLGLLYCNAKLFDQCGVSYPETWEELLSCIDKFNENGITPIMCAGKDLWPAMDYYDILAIRQAGADTCRAALAGEASFEEEPFLEAANKLTELVDAGAFNETDLSLGWDEGIAKFAAGNAAMLYNGTWTTAVVTAEDSAIKDDVVVLNFPALGDGDGDSNEFFGGAFEGFCINANCENPEAAYQAVAYLSEQMSNVSVKTGNGLPAWNSKELDIDTLDPFIAEQYKLATTASGYCLWWDTALGGEAADFHKELVMKLIQKKITPEEFATEMQKINTGLDD